MPILLDNLLTKPIGLVEVGDMVMGWIGDTRFHNTPTGRNGFTESKYRKWDKATVTQVNKRQAEVFEVTLSDGSKVYCTADHHWFTGYAGDLEYLPLIGKRKPLKRLTQFRIPLVEQKNFTDEYKIGYLRGFAEGDGCWMPQKSWRIACKDQEVLYRYKEFLESLGYSAGCPTAFAPYDNMGSLYFKTGDSVNELLNGLDIESLEYWKGWLSGIYDAEGNTPARLDRKTPEAFRISQYKSVNTLTYNRIERALRLFGFGFVQEEKAIRVVGGRTEMARFIQLTQPCVERKRNPLIGCTQKGLLQKQNIVSIVSVGIDTVVSLTTSTGNYVVGGFLSSNCFANLNKPDRTADVKALQAQLRNFQDQENLTAHLLQQKYPVLISNRVDPFATSNYQLTLPTLEALTLHDIPVVIQTRGGRGIDEALQILKNKPSVWYISISQTDEYIRKQIEPGGTSLEARYELIQRLQEQGHTVVVGVNPLVPEWIEEDVLLKKLQLAGIKHIWIGRLHFNTDQINNMTPKEKAAIGATLLHRSKKRGLVGTDKEFHDLFLDKANKLGIHVYHGGISKESLFFSPYHKTYPGKTFPTTQDFINHIWNTKKDGDFVRISDFMDFMLPKLPKGSWPLRDYLASTTRIWKQGKILPKMTYEELLYMFWNNPDLKRNLSIFPNFAFAGSIENGQFEYFADKYDDESLVIHFSHKELTSKEIIYQ